MLSGSCTKLAAGISLQGDNFDLVDLHETIHDLAREEGPIAGQHFEFVLGLAYDVRKAYQGERQVKTVETGHGKATYFGVEILWPIFLVQLAMLRGAAAYVPTQRVHQANLYRLEACAENALRDLDENLASKLGEWIHQCSMFPSSFLMEFVSSQTHSYVYDNTTRKSRIRALPTIMDSFSPYSPAYLAYKKEVHLIAEKEKCRPEDLRDVAEWPEIKW